MERKREGRSITKRGEDVKESKVHVNIMSHKSEKNGRAISRRKRGGRGGKTAEAKRRQKNGRRKNGPILTGKNNLGHK